MPGRPGLRCRRGVQSGNHLDRAPVDTRYRASDQATKRSADQLTTPLREYIKPKACPGGA